MFPGNRRKMTAFPLEGGVQVVGGSETEKFGLRVSLKVEPHFDLERKLNWTIISASIQNNGPHFVEFLFAALLTDCQNERNTSLDVIGNALCSFFCSRRGKRPLGTPETLCVGIYFILSQWVSLLVYIQFLYAESLNAPATSSS